MNVNSTNSNSFSPCKVVSKYFSSIPVMDESLSEFKEKKGSCKGPKNSQKSIVNRDKPKKLPKRIRGQKDIRAALKSKKNEQLTYAKEFDDVCKQAGVDIDSEQLQLAIALSKSINPSEADESGTSQKPLNSQERSKKIRTTLKEYGFAVPEITKTTKRLKNRRKKYKLLLSTDTEKQQIISDRYSQVLFGNAVNSKAIDSNEIDYSLKKCYYVATGIAYMALQNNDILYVENLVEKSTSKGSLLRDWAGIPGRTESPKKKKTFNMNISEIECSQEELDIILSGTLKSAKDIVKNKVDSKSSGTPIIVIVGDNSNPELPDVNIDKNDITLVNEDCINTESTDVSENKTLLLSSDRVRSCSPDIFDDEVSLVIDTSKNDEKNNTARTEVNVVFDLTQDHNDNDHWSQNINRSFEKNNIVMDLTQTENDTNDHTSHPLQQNVTTKSFKPISQCSQTSNFTRRNSNDFMEITECVGISTAKNNLELNDHEIISLGSTKSRRYSEELIEVIGCVAISNSQLNTDKSIQPTNSQVADRTKRKSNDLMELTKCVAGTSNCIPLDVEADIDLTQNSDKGNTIGFDAIVNNTVENIVVSQSSNTDDELPTIHMNKSNTSLDDTIIMDNDEIVVVNPPISCGSNVMTEPCLNASEHTLDLTDTPPSSKKSYDNDLKSSQSFFDEFVYDHSDNTTKESLEKSVQSETNDPLPDKLVDNDEVDLTQSSNSSVASAVQSNNCSIQISKGSLGKNDDVSIDYDEMYDVIVSNGSDVRTKKSGSIIYDENDAKTESENTSRSSQVFDISDKELEYSLNQSRYDAAWGGNFDGISVIDGDLAVTENGNNSENKTDEPNRTIDRSMSESFLPVVKVKHSTITQNAPDNRFKTPVTFSKGKAVTPFKAFENDIIAVSIDTPTCNEYIVKTDQVTPILDYASMSTPERNRELDKYGLKPFKRKRAIQLLTHLYNQTHPIVDACREDLPSPPKRRKPSSPEMTSSYKKVKSPEKSRRKLKSPKKQSPNQKKVANSGIDFMDGNRENIYEVTNELPEVKAIECSEDDWVFQKREKAKIHSCRVPLHVALHNYVSCRRRLREAILRYEPVNIDVIHQELVASGHRYDPKDLLKYLDKKCITVKTADNNARNNKT